MELGRKRKKRNLPAENKKKEMRKRRFRTSGCLRVPQEGLGLVGETNYPRAKLASWKTEGENKKRGGTRGREERVSARKVKNSNDHEEVRLVPVGLGSKGINPHWKG